jgi:4'-phosphopantetheinyl transferase
MAERFLANANEVHVWVVPTDSVGRPLAGALDTEERARAGRFRFAADRERYVARHAALRVLLGTYLDRDPGELGFLRTPHGKPFLEAAGTCNLHFNLSGSGDFSLIGIAHANVGIDVERITDRASLMDIAAAHFRAEERAYLESRTQRERLRTFYRIWTIKEAFLKATGTGLSVPLDRVAVGLDTSPVRVSEPDGPTGRTRYSEELYVAAGYAGAVVVAARDVVTRIARFGAG